MKERIQEEINLLAKAREIKVILACETGSRVWGFASPDSDYDVRMIYVKPLDWYLKLNEGKDTLEVMLDDGELDITGWELRKTLRLLKKSNAALLERLQSPIEYLVDNRFLEGLRAFAETCYSRVATIHHYMSLSKGSLGDIEEKGSYKLKKMFYALRAASACDWILNNDTVPPIQFKELMEGTVMKQSLKNQIYDLIDLKSGKSEAYLHQGEKEIFSYIHQQLDLASDKGATLPAGNYDAQEMDVFFVNVVKSQSSH